MALPQGKTPQPWEIGPHGIISRVAPREQTRIHQSDLAWQARNPDSKPGSYDYYGGELVCESMTYADQITLVAGLRALEIFRNTMQFILRAHDVRQIHGAAQAALILEDKIEREQIAICARIVAEQELAYAAAVEELRKYLAAIEAAEVES
jgi:hypothetical protein